jgi:hypothetical protein
MQATVRAISASALLGQVEIELKSQSRDCCLPIFHVDDSDR